MFTRNNKDRVNLSKLFLSPKQKAEQQAAAKKGSNKGSRLTKSFLSLLLIACTTTVAAYFVVDAKNKYQAENGRVQVAENVSAKKKAPANQIAARNDKQQTAPVKNQAESAETNAYPPLNSDVVTSEPVYKPITRNVPDPVVTLVQYKVKSGAGLYNEPELNTRRTSLQKQQSFEPFNALAEQNGFVYAVLANQQGKTVEGWLRKRDLVEVKAALQAGK